MMMGPFYDQDRIDLDIAEVVDRLTRTRQTTSERLSLHQALRPELCDVIEHGLFDF